MLADFRWKEGGKMGKKERRWFLLGAVLTGVSVLFTILVKVADVKPIGPNGSQVGFAALNGAFHKLIGTHLFWYDVTQGMGIIALLLAAAFAVLGVKQLIERKSLLAVDHGILALGVLYVIVILLYLIFEKFPLNYRPVILDAEEGLEASYPSSHTMLSLCVFGSAAFLLRDLIRDKKLVITLRKILLVFLGVTVLGRLISGVHWFTDILGGCFISGALVSLYAAVLYHLRRMRRRAAEQEF